MLKFFAGFFSYQNKQENAMRCNNRDDLLQLSFTFRRPIFITQLNIYDGAFIAKIVTR